jgi:hypothetical protein
MVGGTGAASLRYTAGDIVGGTAAQVVDFCAPHIVGSNMTFKQVSELQAYSQQSRPPRGHRRRLGRGLGLEFGPGRTENCLRPRE